MSNVYTDQWVENVLMELGEFNCGVSADFLVDFYAEHEQNDIMDLQVHDAGEAATIILKAWERWKITETTGPGDLF